MVHLKKLHGEDIVVNAELIEYVESTPDTTITLTTGHKLMVRETVDELIDKVIAYRRKAYGICRDLPIVTDREKEQE